MFVGKAMEVYNFGRCTIGFLKGGGLWGVLVPIEEQSFRQWFMGKSMQTRSPPEGRKLSLYCHLQVPILSDPNKSLEKCISSSQQIPGLYRVEGQNPPNQLSTSGCLVWLISLIVFHGSYMGPILTYRVATRDRSLPSGGDIICILKGETNVY